MKQARLFKQKHRVHKTMIALIKSSAFFRCTWWPRRSPKQGQRYADVINTANWTCKYLPGSWPSSLHIW
jgi:hypothetical protein